MQQIAVIDRREPDYCYPFTVGSNNRNGEVLVKIALQRHDPGLEYHDLYQVVNGALGSRAFYFLPDYVTLRKRGKRQIWCFDKKLAKYIRQKSEL